MTLPFYLATKRKAIAEMKEMYGFGKIYLVVLNIILVVIMVSCSAQSDTMSETQTTLSSDDANQQSVETPVTEVVPVQSPVSVVATPEVVSSGPGLAMFKGRLIVKVSQKPLPKTAFYLAPATGEGKNEVPPAFSGSQQDTIQGFTDDNGNFVIGNIPPGNYYVFIWAPLNWILLTKADQTENGMPYLLVFQADQELNIGEQFVNWP